VVGIDKFMGGTYVSILDWVAQGKFDGKIDLLDKFGHKAGELMINSSFERLDLDKRNDRLDNSLIGSKRQSSNNDYTDNEILEAFRAFDLDKNNYVGAAEIRHVLVNIGERVSDEEVSCLFLLKYLAQHLFILKKCLTRFQSFHPGR